jgi:hypothetical protein
VSTQRIETTVVAHSVIRISLKCFATKITEFGPHITHCGILPGQILRSVEALARFEMSELG